MTLYKTAIQNLKSNIRELQLYYEVLYQVI